MRDPERGPRYLLYNDVHQFSLRTAEGSEQAPQLFADAFNDLQQIGEISGTMRLGRVAVGNVAEDSNTKGFDIQLEGEVDEVAVRKLNALLNPGVPARYRLGDDRIIRSEDLHGR